MALEGRKVATSTEPLDVRGLVDLTGYGVPEARRVPIGTSVGHIHPRVGGLAKAEMFNHGLLGLDVTSHLGATFNATGGYHHRDQHLEQP